ncbi:MAG: hypothetical protein KBT44_00900 [Bacteroidales bacterium]|nr:hypothetical protein [Candidatus Equibacterium intestinale]
MKNPSGRTSVENVPWSPEMVTTAPVRLSSSYSSVPRRMPVVATSFWQETARNAESMIAIESVLFMTGLY